MGKNDFDLTQGGAANSFRLLVGAESGNATLVVRVSGVGGTSTTAPIAIPVTTNGASATLNIPFSSLTGSASLTQIGAIQLEINQDGPGCPDRQSSALRSHRLHANIANLNPMTIGNLVFLDRNNDSLFAGADTGIGGVDLQLFNDVNTNGTYEPGTDTAVTVGTSVATTSSSVGTLGQYSFTGLLPGSYVVLIPAASLPLVNRWPITSVVQTSQPPTQ